MFHVMYLFPSHVSCKNTTDAIPNAWRDFDVGVWKKGSFLDDGTLAIHEGKTQFSVQVTNYGLSYLL